MKILLFLSLLVSFTAFGVTPNELPAIQNSETSTSDLLLLYDSSAAVTKKYSLLELDKRYNSSLPWNVAGDLLYYSGSAVARLPRGNNGQVLTMVSGLPGWADVESGNQTANTVFAGPSSGSATAPSFRTLVSADIPAINLAGTGSGGITGNLGITHLNTGSGASSSTFWRGDGTWGIPSGTGGTWGTITGTLSAQTDLNTALGLKAPLASPTFTGTIGTPLTGNRLVVTDSGGNLAVSAAGTSGNVLTSNGSSLATFQAPSVSLATQVTGNLPVGNLNGGSGATGTTFWRGDGTWGAPANSVDAGNSVDLVTGITLGDLGFGFVGSAPNEVAPHTIIPLYSPGLTGWKVNPNSDHASDYLSFYTNGNMAYQVTNGGGEGPNSSQIMLINGTVIRPADTLYVSTLGTPTYSFGAAYAKAFYFGGEVGNSGAATRKKVFIDDRNVPNGSPGIGFDSSQGNEWYFASMDPAHGYATKENFSLFYNDRTTTVSAPDDAVADANPAPSFIYKGANKTAGTGAGGDVILSGSASSGGVAGQVFIPDIADPASVNTHSGFVAMWYNHVTSKFCVNDAGTVKCATMAP